MGMIGEYSGDVVGIQHTKRASEQNKTDEYRLYRSQMKMVEGKMREKKT
jgi:hypothetical protein